MPRLRDSFASRLSARHPVREQSPNRNVSLQIIILV